MSDLALKRAMEIVSNDSEVVSASVIPKERKKYGKKSQTWFVIKWKKKNSDVIFTSRISSIYSRSK